MRIMSWKCWLTVVVGLNFFGSCQALCVYFWTPWFSSDPEHPMLKACGLQATLQLGPATLPSLVFTSNPEPPRPLQLDPSHGRESGMAGLPELHPTAASPQACVLAWWLLSTKKGFLSFLSGCFETPEAEMWITRSAEQAACSFERKLKWSIKLQLVTVLAAIVLFVFTAADRGFTTATSALSHRDPVVSNASLKKKKKKSKEENETFMFSFYIYCCISIFPLSYQEISRPQKPALLVVGGHTPAEEYQSNPWCFPSLLAPPRPGHWLFSQAFLWVAGC